MKIIVIGAGLIGLASSYYLRQQGHSVTVVERRAGPALETSFANAGMLTPSQAEPWNTPGIFSKLVGWVGREDAPVLLRFPALPSLLPWGLRFLWNSQPERFVANSLANARLARFSLSELQILRAKEHLDYGQICNGTIKVYRDAASFEEGVQLAEMVAGAGVRLRIMDGHDAIGVEPALEQSAGTITGAIHFPEDESGDAYLFCRSLTTALVTAGVEFLYGTSVDGLQRSGNRVTCVDTSAGPLPADSVVICAGSHSPRLGQAMGVFIPVRPVKGYSITVPMQSGVSTPRMAVVDDARHAAITPMNGRLRVAGTAEFAGFNTDLTPARIRNLLDVVAGVFPRHLPEAGVDISPWAGLRPYCCDGVPVIGRTALENLFLNTGHGHLGWTLAAGSGMLLSQLLAGQAPELDPAPYSPQRF